MIYNIWEMFGKFRASQAVHVLHSPVAQPWLQLHDVLQDARAIFWGHLNVRRWLLCTGEESEDLLGGYAQSVSAQQPVHYIYTIYIFIYTVYIYTYIHSVYIYTINVHQHHCEYRMNLSGLNFASTHGSITIISTVDEAQSRSLTIW